MADKELILDVKTNIDDAAKDAEKLGDNLEEAGDKGKKGFKGIGTAIKGIGTALKAAGIGIVVALLAKLMDVFRQNQKVVDTFDIAMESLSIAFNDLFSFISDNIGNITGWFKDIFENPQEKLKDFGKAIKENLIERFESLMDTFGHLGKALGHLFKGEFAEAWGSVKDAGKESIDVLTGVNNTVDKTKDTIVNYTKEVVKTAKAVVELNKASELAKVQVQGIIEEYDRQAEKLRQVRDDETKTFDERIAANTKLGEVLKEQGEKMQELVDIQVHAAQVEFKKNESQENLIALTEALNEKKAVEAQITGFQSEQLTNQVALEKELLEAKNELLLAGLEGIELELAELENAYQLKLDMARKAGEDDVAITEQYEKQKAEIKKEYSKIAEEIVKAEEDAKRQLIETGFGVAGELAGEHETLSKAVAVAQTIYNTQQGIMAAMAATSVADKLLPYPVRLANAIATGLMGASAVNKILSTSPSSASGGGGAGGSGGTPRAEIQSGAFTLEGGQEPEPARAYVVSDDITNSQNKLANIRRRATI